MSVDFAAVYLPLTCEHLCLCVVPVPNRPTTPLTAGALVPPPRPSSRPKLPTGKLTGINEIVSSYPHMCNMAVISATIAVAVTLSCLTLHSGTAVQPAQVIERQPSSCCCTTRPSRKLFLAVLECLTQCRKHPHCR